MNKKFNQEFKLDEIEYVFFDMDGTMLTSNRTPSPKSLEAISELRKRNIKVSIATGRPYYLIQDEIDFMNPDLPIITCNSALVYDDKEAKLLATHFIKKELVKPIYDILTKHNAIFVVYTDREMFLLKNPNLNPQSKWFDWFKKVNDKNVEKNHPSRMAFLNDYSQFNIENYDIVKFLIIYSEIPTQQYKEIEKEVSKFNDVYLVRSQDEVFDIMPSGLNKGEGLLKLEQQGLINLNKTLVFGDAENDISMFKVAKWSVAMGNAQEKTKEAADFITDTNNNDGIYKFISQLLKK